VKGAVKGRNPPFTPVTRAVTKAETPADPIERWALMRLDILAQGELLARDAHRDFLAWCADSGAEPCSLPAFGKRFTPVFLKMGGRKLKSRNGVVYVGIDLVTERRISDPNAFRALQIG
jgi:hypothetical protein